MISDFDHKNLIISYNKVWTACHTHIFWVIILLVNN